MAGSAASHRQEKDYNNLGTRVISKWLYRTRHQSWSAKKKLSKYGQPIYIVRKFMIS